MNRLEVIEKDLRETKRKLEAIEQHLERVGITDDAVFSYPPKPRDIDYKIDLLAQHFELHFEIEKKDARIAELEQVIEHD